MKLIDVTEEMLAPLHYDRNQIYGIPDELQHQFLGTEELKYALVSLTKILDQVKWLSNIEYVLTAGTYVVRQQRNADNISIHSYGQAIDFDGAVLINNTIRTLGIPRSNICEFNSKEYTIEQLPLSLRVRFANMVSLCFGVVLTEDYNKIHNDHIHADVSQIVKYRNGESQNKLIQRTLNVFFEEDLIIDGKVGSKTLTAFSNVTKQIVNNSISNEQWMKFVYSIATDPPED